MYEIELEKTSHEYKVDGIIRPGVTTILEERGISDISSIPHAVLLKAQDRGTAVHTLCEMVNKGVDPYEHPQCLHYQSYLKAYLQFMEQFGSKIVASELMLYSPKYGFCGTIDLVMRINGKLCVIDIKSGLEYASYKIQTAAYKQLWNDNFPDTKIKDRYALYLRKSGLFNAEKDLIQYKDKTDEYVWNAALLITKFIREN